MTQSGTGRVIPVTQSGTGRVIPVTQSGTGRVIPVTQSGTGASDTSDSKWHGASDISDSKWHSSGYPARRLALWGWVLGLVGPVSVYTMEMESFICNFYLSVAACEIVRADPSLRYTRMLLGR